jgi:hypothetical protein
MTNSSLFCEKNLEFELATRKISSLDEVFRVASLGCFAIYAMLAKRRYCPGAIQ